MKTKGSGQSALLLLDVIDVLNKFKISYAVVEALAASFYGVVRASLDADAVISLAHSKTNIGSLTDEFEKSHLKTAYRKGDADDPIGAVLVIEDGFRNRVDLLMNIRGMTEAVFSRAVLTDFMDTKIRLVGIEDFLAMKIFAGGPKDIDDARGVLKVSGKNVNLPLLKSLVKPYGKEQLAVLESLLKRG